MRTLIMLLLSALSTIGADLYVSVSGSGNATGSDWTNTLAQTFTPVRGNTYYLADGAYSAKTWTVSRSGSSYITVKKATIADHGTSTGWSDTMGDGEATFSGDVNIQSSEFIFSGTTRASWTNGYGFRVIGNTIKLGVNFGLNVTNVEVRYVQVDGSDDYLVDEDNLAVVGGGKKGIIISHCYFHDPGNSCIQANNCEDLTVQYSMLARNQGAGAAHSEIIVATGNNNLTLRYNIFDEAESTAAIGTPTAGHPGCAGGTFTPWYIYGNVFRGPFTTGNGAFYIFDCTVTDLYIYNNTFVGINNAFTGASSGGGGDGCITTFYAKNNLYIGASQGLATANVTSVNFSHNAYWSCSMTDAGTSIYSTTGAPLDDYTNYDFDLTSSAASSMDAATTLSNTGSHTFDVDMNGVTRGADGKWDRGALEFAGGSPTITTNNASGVRLRGWRGL